MLALDSATMADIWEQRESSVTDLFLAAAAGLRSLQALQRRYDDEMWDIDDPIFAKIRHIQLHLSITVGKLARALEPLDHREHRDEQIDLADLTDALGPVLADLVMHAAQLANAVGEGLPGALRARYQQNAKRFAPSSAFAGI